MDRRMIATVMIVLPVLTGCAKKETQPEYVGTSTFPLITDSRWEYDRIIEIATFNDSVAVDSEFYDIYRHVIGPDTIIDDNQMIAVDDSVFRADSVDQNPSVIRHLYCISEGKLQEFGQVGIDPSGEEYPIYFSPPRVILDLPITPYKSWIESADESSITRNEVVGIQYFSAPGIEIKCDVIKSQFMNQSGHVYSETYYWYSNSGLIRRRSESVQIPEGKNGALIDSVRIVNILELIDMDVQSE
jgi:hypothetical protein